MSEKPIPHLQPDLSLAVPSCVLSKSKQPLALISRAQAAIESIAPAARVLLRVLGGVAGAYALTAALVALLSVALPLTGLARSEAVVLAAMLGFVTYLLLLLWAFSVRSLRRLWAVMGIGTALCTALAAYLSQLG
jgi:hypothetical protein